MGSDSKREKILLHLEKSLRGLAWLKTLVREQPGAPADLEKYGQTQFPVLAMLGQLPAPRSERLAGRGKEFVSALDAQLVVYALHNQTPDSLVSSMADDIWAALFSDRSCGGLALDLTVLPEVEKGVYPPYLAFSLIARITYAHDHTGI